MDIPYNPANHSIVSNINHRLSNDVPYRIVPNMKPLFKKHFKGTNNVRCIETHDTITIHLPAYIYIRYYNIVDIDFTSNTVNLNASIIFNLYYGQLPQQWLQQIGKKLILSIGNRMHLELMAEQFVQNPERSLKKQNDKIKKVLTYIIKGIFQTGMTTNIFMCPFEEIDVDMNIIPTVQQCQFLGKVGDIKINPMEKYVGDKLAILDMIYLVDKTSHCQYYLRAQGCNVSTEGKYFLNDESKDVYDTLKKDLKDWHSTKQKKYQDLKAKYQLSDDDLFFLNDSREFNGGAKPLQCKEIKFKIKLIKDPLQTFLSVIVPLAFISVVSFSVYLMDNVFNDRIATIATLLITYTTFIPTIRQRTLISPRLTLMDFVVISIMLLSIFSLIRSLIDKGKNVQTQTQWKKDPFFWIPLGIWVLIYILLITLFIRIKLMIRERGEDNIQSKAANDVAFEFWSNKKLEEAYNNQKTQRLVSFQSLVQNNHIFQRLWIQRLLKDAQTKQHNLFKPSNNRQNIWERQVEQMKFYNQYWSNRCELSEYFRSFMPYVQYFYVRVKNMQKQVNRVLNNSQESQQHADVGYPVHPDIQIQALHLRLARKKLIEAYVNMKQVDKDQMEFKIQRRLQA